MPKDSKAEGPDKTAFEIMSRLVKQPPKTHFEMTAKPKRARAKGKPSPKRAQAK